MKTFKKSLLCIAVAASFMSMTVSATTEPLHTWSTSDGTATDINEPFYSWNYMDEYYNGGWYPVFHIAVLPDDYNEDGVINYWDTLVDWRNITSVELNFTDVTSDYMAICFGMGKINTYQLYSYRYTGPFNDEEVVDYPITTSFKSTNGIVISDTPDGDGVYDLSTYRAEPIYLEPTITDNTAVATAYIKGSFFEVPVDNNNHNTKTEFIEGMGGTFVLGVDMIDFAITEGSASLSSIVFKDASGNVVYTISGKELAGYNGTFTNGSYETVDSNEAGALTEIETVTEISGEAGKILAQTDGTTCRIYKLVTEAAIENKTTAEIYLKSSANANIIKVTAEKCYTVLDGTAAPEGYYYIAFVINNVPEGVTFYSSDITIK